MQTGRAEAFVEKAIPQGVGLARVRPVRRHRASPASPIVGYLDRLWNHHAELTAGEVATYIPELASADPAAFGICVATVDGAVYETGDTTARFTLQSLSKPLAYGIALERHGDVGVRARIGVEPSGEAFNAISLDPATGAPRNPMINAGAIAATWLAGEGLERPFEHILDVVSRCAGRRLAVSGAVFRSEQATGFRNRAIAHLLRNAGVIEGDPDAASDLYFRQCAVEVDCRDLGVIAATLANGGVNPLTGERALRGEAVRDVLSVMSSCGMYDAAGAWLVEIGLPAKSGVSGGVLAVLPGRLGIGVFSPPLDAQGNSVRGLAVCRAISRDLSLHLVRPGEVSPSPIRSAFTLVDTASKRIRPQRDREALRASGHRMLGLELQGELDFRAVELVARRLEDAMPPPRLVVLELRRVERAQRAAVELLADLARGIAHEGGTLVLSGGATHDALVAQLEGCLTGVAGASARFRDLDHAIEWCEAVVLDEAGISPDARVIEPRDHALLRDLPEEELALVLDALRALEYAPGAVLFEEGDPAEDLYLVSSGDLSVSVRGSDGASRRIATLSSGMLFGELALVDRSPRTATVTADTHVVCHALSFSALEALGATNPRLEAALLAGVLRVAGGTARRLSVELSHAG